MLHSKHRAMASAIDWGCGMVIEVFAGTSTGVMDVQWLWAAPESELERRGLSLPAALDRIDRRLRKIGFSAESEPGSRTALPNGFSVDEPCPFASDTCLGSHLVVSGSGQLKNRRRSVRVLSNASRRAVSAG